MRFIGGLRHHPWGFIVAGALVFASWLIPPIRALWDVADAAAFHAFNGSLAWGKPWQVFWAIANNRGFDAVVGFLFFLLGAWYCLERRGRFQWRRAARLLVALVLMSFFAALAAISISEVGYRRRSPSIELEESALMLNHLVPEIPCKDSSKSSFPGDHAFISFWVGMFFLLWGSRRFAAVAMVLVVISIMPRLVGGAHWMTDLAVGSLTMLFLGVGLMTMWPLRRRAAERWVERMLRRYTPAVIRRFLPGE